MRTIKWLCLLLALVLLCGCSGAPEPDEVLPAATPEPTAEPAEPEEPAEPRYVEYVGAEFHEDLAEGDDAVKVDFSAANEGYVGVSGISETRLKVQVIKGEDTYTYDLAIDGTPSIFPLQCGDGTYTLRVMENVVDSKYVELYNTTCDVTLDDEFQPYIRPSDYVNYNEDSECVEKAAEIAGGSNGELDVVSAVYDYICSHVVYDTLKAQTVESGYLPEPDDTLDEGQGICFDYASLAAAMLRSQGIPVKVIFGYVSPDNVYHAWNMFYTEETGWVSVSFEVSADTWNRLDLTFSANGSDSEFIGDGSNYADVYHY